MTRIGIIGAGVVGKAVGKSFARYGYEIVFCDVDLRVLKDLKTEGYEAVGPEDIPDMETSHTIISVSTPTVNGRIDLSYLEEACRTTAMVLKRTLDYHLVVINCTLPPGTTQEFIIPTIESWSGKYMGCDFGVCYNPEFIREATALEDFIKPWVIVIGVSDQRDGQALYKLYGPITNELDIPLFMTDFKTAEMVKYASNMFNAMKISFTNEIWCVCKSLGIEGDKIMSIVSQSAEGMWNPRYGIRGGYPYGGMCLPKDTSAFLSFAEAKGLKMNLLQAVINVNDVMATMDNREAIKVPIS